MNILPSCSGYQTHRLLTEPLVPKCTNSKVLLSHLEAVFFLVSHGVLDAVMALSGIVAS